MRMSVRTWETCGRGDGSAAFHTVIQLLCPVMSRLRGSSRYGLPFVIYHCHHDCFLLLLVERLDAMILELCRASPSWFVPNSCQFLFGLSRFVLRPFPGFQSNVFNRIIDCSRTAISHVHTSHADALQLSTLLIPPASCFCLPSPTSGSLPVRSYTGAMRHGINAVPREQQSSKGRISIISPLCGNIWKSTSVVRVVLTPWLSGNECHKNTIWYSWDVH